MKITTIADKSIFSPELQMNSEQKLMFIPSASVEGTQCCVLVPFLSATVKEQIKGISIFKNFFVNRRKSENYKKAFLSTGQETNK